MIMRPIPIEFNYHRGLKTPAEVYEEIAGRTYRAGVCRATQWPDSSA